VNLYLSVILRPPVAAAVAPQLNLLAAVAVAEAIAQVGGLTPAIKWPNDVLINGKKVCGILAEMQTDATALQAVVLGIGVNLNAPLDVFPEDLREKASSLFIAGGRLIDRPAFAASLLTHLEKLYVLWIEKGFAALKPVWEYYAAWLLGKQITVAAPEGIVTGIVLGLDNEGALLVREGNNATLRRLLAGDVTVVGAYTPGESQ
jgi:BirA family biotin operon repressor/biotin-[acetyl-CoA-carboxylase] ligase